MTDDAMATDRELRCPACGRVLARVVSGRRIATNGSTFPFGRRTDHLSCDGCEVLVPVHALRGDLAQEPATPDPPAPRDAPARPASPARRRRAGDPEDAG